MFLSLLHNSPEFWLEIPYNEEMFKTCQIKVESQFSKLNLKPNKSQTFPIESSPRGLDAVDSFLRDGGDPYAYVSVDALIVLMNLDGDLSCDTHKPNWKSLIAAVQGGNSVHVDKSLMLWLYDIFLLFFGTFL